MKVSYLYNGNPPTGFSYLISHSVKHHLALIRKTHEDLSWILYIGAIIEYDSVSRWYKVNGFNLFEWSGLELNGISFKSQDRVLGVCYPYFS